MLSWQAVCRRDSVACSITVAFRLVLMSRYSKVRAIEGGGSSDRGSKKGNACTLEALESNGRFVGNREVFWQPLRTIAWFDNGLGEGAMSLNMDACPDKKRNRCSPIPLFSRYPTGFTGGLFCP